MVRNLYFLLIAIIITITAIGSCSAQNSSCPPPELLAPCTCDEDTLRFYCSGPGIDLKAIFDRVSPLIGDNVIFSDILIARVPGMQTIPANTMSTLKFRRITVEYNAELEFIHADAFNGTYDVTTRLHLGNNRLSNSNSSRDNFDFVRRFAKLEMLSLRERYLETIPSEPFDLSPNLQTLQFEFVSLVSVGSRIFANLPNLTEAQLNYYDMELDGFAPDAFEGIGPNVVLNMEQNPVAVFSTLPEGIFKPVLEDAAGLVVGGEVCIGIGICFKVQLDCDSRVSWLCENESSYIPKLSGYYCKGYAVPYDIWAWCRDNAGR